MIRVQCPHCERRYRTVTEVMGKPAVCSKCKQTFRIGESRPPFQWKPTDLAEASWIGVQPPEEREKLGLGIWGVEFRASKKVETSNVIIPANPMATQVKGQFEARMVKSLDELVTAGQISDSLRR